MKEGGQQRGKRIKTKEAEHNKGAKEGDKQRQHGEENQGETQKENKK